MKKYYAIKDSNGRYTFCTNNIQAKRFNNKLRWMYYSTIHPIDFFEDKRFVKNSLNFLREKNEAITKFNLTWEIQEFTLEECKNHYDNPPENSFIEEYKDFEEDCINLHQQMYYKILKKY